jgi:bacterial/archaeal transporter family-2 protein
MEMSGKSGQPTPIEHEHHSAATMTVTAGIAAVIGALSSYQAHLNAEMAELLHDPREAAELSMVTGLALLSGLVAFQPSLRHGLAKGVRAYRSGNLAWWQLLGGLGGATFIAGQSVVVPRVGVALFTVAVVGAQTAVSLLVDRAGLGPAGRRAVTMQRIVAAGIAVIAVAVSVWGKGATFSIGPLVLAVAAGALVAVQYAVNGRVGVASGEPLVAAWVNFVVGFAALLVVFLAGLVIVGGGVHRLPSGHWWLYLSGPIGVVFVTLAAWVVRILGVLFFSLCVVAGQVAGAVVIDLIAPARPHAVGPATLVGVALTVLAVAVGSGLVRWRGTT